MLKTQYQRRGQGRKLIRGGNQTFFGRFKRQVKEFEDIEDG